MQAVFFRACGLSSKGDAVPPGYVSGSGETGNDTPLSSAQRTRPRRRGAGRGKKVRYTPRLFMNLLRKFYFMRAAARSTSVEILLF